MTMTMRTKESKATCIVDIIRSCSCIGVRLVDQDADKKIIDRRQLGIIDPHEYSFRSPIRLD